MSESAAGKFSELWKGVSKLCDGKTFIRVTEQQMAATETSAIKGDGGVKSLHRSAQRETSQTECQFTRSDSGFHCVLAGFQSPQGRHGCARLGLFYGDSPGDVEPSQDIVWDCTSPNAGGESSRLINSDTCVVSFEMNNSILQ